MTFELPFELFARVLLALLSDVGNTTIARAFPWADEQLCRHSSGTLEAFCWILSIHELSVLQ